jgi:hypothetical protein
MRRNLGKWGAKNSPKNSVFGGLKTTFWYFLEHFTETSRLNDLKNSKKTGFFTFSGQF